MAELIRKRKFKTSKEMLSEIIIDAEIKLLNEGFFDELLNPKQAAASYKQRQALLNDQKEQKRKERQRVIYQNKGLPMPAEFTKKELRKYYTTNRLPVPKFLQGSENADTDPRGDEEGVDNLVTFFAKKLNMHPGQEKKIKSGLKSAGAGIKTTGSFLGNLYKKITGTDFFPGGRVPPEEELTDMASGVGTASGSGPSSSASSSSLSSGASSSSSSGGGPGISSYASSLIAGLPGKVPMFYLYITDLKNYMYANGQANTGDLEADARSFIINHVEKDVFKSGKKDVIEVKFANGKRIDWEVIARFIKTENSNDKNDMKKYICGHYFVGKNTSTGILNLKPIGNLPGVKEGDLK